MKNTNTACLIALLFSANGFADDGYLTIPGVSSDGPSEVLTSWRVGSEHTVHVAFHSRSYSILLTSDQSKSVIKLTSIPFLCEDGGLSRHLQVGSFTIHADHDVVALLFEYSYSSGGRLGSDTKPYLGVCVLQRGGLVGRCEGLPVGYTDILNVQNDDPKLKWLYLGSNAGPARSSYACPLARDVDSDGYADIVLWGRDERSVLLDEHDPDDESALGFVVESEALLVMRFDPQSHRFLEPRPAPELELPSTYLCEGNYR